jgi:ATP-dependent helicase YprA (DUF1998 family)
MTNSISQTTDALHSALRDYIQATYHVSHPTLVKLRRDLLEAPGVISATPYIESTKRYQTQQRYEELGLPTCITQLFAALSDGDNEKPLIFNPPYSHQARALQETLNHEKSLLVMTGTGSGKTECFLLPILGKLFREASERPSSFGTAAVRALVLYPMNALVNDQVGRLRALLGDSRVSGAFKSTAAGRPARFARYTSRTPYAGVKKAANVHADKLKSLYDFYVLKSSSSDPNDQKLVKELKRRGKWPAKPNLTQWFGEASNPTCVTQSDDVELMLRHEVQTSPPDVLVTNYSMLEYMLMRPLERGIFDATKKWLAANPSENFILVVDEAHLYRGAQGTEVAMLIRRLRTRLGLPAERMQVICTSASFTSPATATEFAAKLTAAPKDKIVAIEGSLALRLNPSKGIASDVMALASVQIEEYHQADIGSGVRASALAPILSFRGRPLPPSMPEVDSEEVIQAALFAALEDYGPLSTLINESMERALTITELQALVFDGDAGNAEERERATATLLALGSLARKSRDSAPLVSSRVHSFHRALAGVWACLDPDCSELPVASRGGPTGRLYSQPHTRCGCGARVFELHTCRDCGAAYAQAYVEGKGVLDPEFVWPSPGTDFQFGKGEVPVATLQPIHLLLEEPPAGAESSVRERSLSLRTGSVRSVAASTDRVRKIWTAAVAPKSAKQKIRTHGRSDAPGHTGCLTCKSKKPPSTHQTSGDQPFGSLVAAQIRTQPPLKPLSRFAPLRGRKVMLFSDSRQMAARLAAVIEQDALKEALRPLLVAGYRRLAGTFGAKLTLEDLVGVVWLEAHRRGVRLRPELQAGENNFKPDDEIGDAEIDSLSPLDLYDVLTSLRGCDVPMSLARVFVHALRNPHYGLAAVGLATVCEADTKALKTVCEALPNLPNLAERVDDKVEIFRLWIRVQVSKYGMRFKKFPQATTNHWEFYVSPTLDELRLSSKELGSTDTQIAQLFNENWLPKMIDMFIHEEESGERYLQASKLTIDTSTGWRYCSICRTPRRSAPNHCEKCGQLTAELSGEAKDIFRARKGFFRSDTMAALQDDKFQPFAVIAEEHTAQVNTAQEGDTFSAAERYELRFQDVEIRGKNNRIENAVDILSCTTTMEVGIDIGELSGVALRNLPPARSNYQQRAGRAGRRGNAIATVVAYAGADNHDGYYFANPAAMIRGPVMDPLLTLANIEIGRRHLTAFVIQRFLQTELPQNAGRQKNSIFEVLGTVRDFLDSDGTGNSLITKARFNAWVAANEQLLVAEALAWLPAEIADELVEDLARATLAELNRALPKPENDGANAVASTTGIEVNSAEEDYTSDAPDEVGDPSANTSLKNQNLLDRLFYQGVLPRYAFPTDVATFHVAKKGEKHWSPKFRWTPSQSTATALSQYAPGRELYIAKQVYRSQAIYSPVRADRKAALERARHYQECTWCGWVNLPSLDDHVQPLADCRACGTQMPPARTWLKPPGFAHPFYEDGKSASASDLELSYASTAKLSDSLEGLWQHLIPSGRIQSIAARPHLIVTNCGSDNHGFEYCNECGFVATASEAFKDHNRIDRHTKSRCPNGTSKLIVLGTDFITDVLTVRFSLTDEVQLPPGATVTRIVLQTVCEAMALAAARRFDIEPTELAAGFRAALSEAGTHGSEVEIYLYDTLAGGAGYARACQAQLAEILKDALDILRGCHCDCSCYSCLRSFKNKLIHESLDRKLGAVFLEHVISGILPRPIPERQRDLLLQIAQQLEELRENVTYELDVPLSTDAGQSFTAPMVVKIGNQPEFIIALTSALCSLSYEDDALKRNMLLPLDRKGVDELLSFRNLPAAIEELTK